MQLWYKLLDMYEFQKKFSYVTNVTGFVLEFFLQRDCNFQSEHSYFNLISWDLITVQRLPK